MTLPQAKAHGGRPASNSSEKRHRPSPEPSKEARPRQHLGFRLLPSLRNCERIKLSGFRPSSPATLCHGGPGNLTRPQAAALREAGTPQGRSSLRASLEAPGPRSRSCSAGQLRREAAQALPRRSRARPPLHRRPPTQCLRLSESTPRLQNRSPSFPFSGQYIHPLALRPPSRATANKQPPSSSSRQLPTLFQWNTITPA